MTFIFKQISTKLQFNLNETVSLTAASKTDQMFHKHDENGRPKSNGNVEEKTQENVFCPDCYEI